jgi:hypothetical protein
MMVPRPLWNYELVPVQEATALWGHALMRDVGITAIILCAHGS